MQVQGSQIMRLGRKAIAAGMLLVCAGAGAQQGNWKLEVHFSGSAASQQWHNPAGATPVLTNTINNVPVSSSLDLATIPNTPANTYTGGVTAHLAIRAGVDARMGEGAVYQSGSGAITVVLVWQPRNNDPVLDPPPPRVKILVRRELKGRVYVSANATGTAAKAVATGTLGATPNDPPLHLPPFLDVDIPRDGAPPNTVERNGAASDLGPIVYPLDVLPNGTAAFCIGIEWDAGTEAHAMPTGGGGTLMKGPIIPNAPIPPIGARAVSSVQIDAYLDLAISGIGAPRGPMGGANGVNGSDPSFTRWLPLAFSPHLNSQPFRSQAGSLPTPWGNVNCAYSLTLRAETGTPNYDLFGHYIEYRPDNLIPCNYNNPLGSWQVLGNTADSEPAYWITDADGDRLAFYSDLSGAPGIRSQLQPYGSGFRLVNAGPPGDIDQAGRYAYTFEGLAGSPARARLVAIADDIGNTHALSWSSGLVVTDSSSGRSLVFSGAPYFTSVNAPGAGGMPGTHTALTWDSGGHLTQLKVYETGSNQPVRTDTFAYAGDTLTAVEQGGAATAYSYVADANVWDPFNLLYHRLASAADGLATDTTSSDDGGSVQGTYTFSVGTTALGYNNWGIDARTNSVTDPRGNTTSVTYGIAPDAPVRVKSATVKGPAFHGAPANSNVWKLVCTPDLMTPGSATLTDPLGLNWTASLDAAGNVTTATDPLVGMWQFGYSLGGTELTAATDPTGLTWLLNYGENGAPASRLTSVVDPSNATRVTAQYNAYGQPTSVTVPAAVAASGQNETTQFAYDPVTGDLTAVVSPLGTTTTIGGYDPLGDPLSVSVSAGAGQPALSTYLTWDAGQQLVHATLPNGAQTVNTWTNGVVTRVEANAPAGAGGATLSRMDFDYDTRGRLYAASDLMGSAAQYRYDRSSNLTRVLDGRGNATQLTYGSNDEPISLTWPGGQAASINYDAAGRTAASTDERGVLASYQYDNAHRLTGVAFPAYPSQGASIQWDPADRPLAVTDATGSTTFTYDPVVKRLTGVQTLLGGRTYTVSFGYAGDGKVVSMTTPAGTTNYGYDADGRMALMTAPAGDTTSWTYDGAGRVTSETTLTTAGKTITTAYGFGPSGQPGDPSTAPAYLRTITQTVNGQTFKTYTLSHSYLGQTTAVAASGGTSGETEDSEMVTVFGVPYGASGGYQWDLSNNLQGGTGGWSHNSNNQVTSAPPMGGLAGASGLGYDASGNLTSANGMGLAWDAWGNLASVSGAPGNPSFTYDAFGRRVSKTVSGVTTYYLYAGSLLVCELDAQGSVLRSYNWGALGLVSDASSSGTRYYLFDDRGDTRSLLDANGNLLARGAYTAWGSPIQGLAPGVPMGWKGRFGVYTDAETGLMLMGARYYAPCIGRFISRDPIGFDGGINLYGYCYGDPISYSDPSGEDAADTIRLIADAASFVPGLNVPGSMVSGGISLAKGDFVGAALAGVSIIPRGRWVVAGGRAAKTIFGAVKVGRVARSVRSVAAATRVARVAAKPAQAARVVREVGYAGRGALRRAMLKLGPPPFAGAQAHHGLPYILKHRFAKLGLDVSDAKYGWWVGPSHQKWSNDYQRAWEGFFEKPDVTADDVLHLLERSRNDPRWR